MIGDAGAFVQAFLSRVVFKTDEKHKECTILVDESARGCSEKKHQLVILLFLSCEKFLSQYAISVYRGSSMKIADDTNMCSISGGH